MPRLLSLLLLVLAAAGCSATRPDDAALAVFRAAYWRPDSPRSDASKERIESLRERQELIAARDLALDLAEDRPEDGEALALAARAESDFVVCTASDEAMADARKLAAWSALDFAERAAAAGAADAAARAELAWAQGGVTHLLPMFGRASHAQVVQRSADEALSADPDQPTAWATLAVLRYRLATLPWIADLFAVGAPEATLEDAIAAGERAVAAAPSLQNALQLANALEAAGRAGEGINVVRAALEDGRTFPRDLRFDGEARRRIGAGP